jgi:hypothetical protein
MTLDLMTLYTTGELLGSAFLGGGGGNLAAYQQGLAIRERLARQDATNTERQRDLIVLSNFSSVDASKVHLLLFISSESLGG